MPPFGLHACVHAVNASFFVHAETAETDIAQRHAVRSFRRNGTRERRRDVPISEWWRLLLGAVKPKKEIEIRASGDGDKAVLNIQNAAATTAHTL